MIARLSIVTLVIACVPAQATPNTPPPPASAPAQATTARRVPPPSGIEQPNRLLTDASVRQVSTATVNGRLFRAVLGDIAGRAGMGHYLAIESLEPSTAGAPARLVTRKYLDVRGKARKVLITNMRWHNRDLYFDRYRGVNEKCHLRISRSNTPQFDCTPISKP